MRYAFLLIAMLLALPAAAQVSNPQGPTLSQIIAVMPQPASTAPICVADSSVVGSDTAYARANHTHCSKARKARIQSAADGSLTYTFETAFGAGVVPRCVAVAEVAVGITDVVNVQLVGTPTNVTAVFLVNRTQRSVVSLIGLTVLSVPASPGATWVHILCLEP